MSQVSKKPNKAHRYSLRRNRMVVIEDDAEFPIIVGEKHEREIAGLETIDLTLLDDSDNPRKAQRSDDHDGLIDPKFEEEKVFREQFDDATCPVCHNLLYRPVTLECGHNLCESCMARWMSAFDGIMRCPAGCSQIIPERLPPVSITLANIISHRFPQETKKRQLEDASLAATVTMVRTVQGEAAHHAPPIARLDPIPLLNVPIVQQERAKRTISHLVSMNMKRCQLSLLIVLTCLLASNIIGPLDTSSWSILKPDQSLWNGLKLISNDLSWIWTHHDNDLFNWDDCSSKSPLECYWMKCNVLSLSWSRIFFPPLHFPFLVAWLVNANKSYLTAISFGTLLVRSDLLKLELFGSYFLPMLVSVKNWMKYPNRHHFRLIGRILIRWILSCIGIYLILLVRMSFGLALCRILSFVFNPLLVSIIFWLRFLFFIVNCGMSKKIIACRFVDDRQVLVVNRFDRHVASDGQFLGNALLEANENQLIKRLAEHCVDIVSIIISSEI